MVNGDVRVTFKSILQRASCYYVTMLTYFFRVHEEKVLGRGADSPSTCCLSTRCLRVMLEGFTGKTRHRITSSSPSVANDRTYNRYPYPDKGEGIWKTRTSLHCRRPVNYNLDFRAISLDHPDSLIAAQFPWCACIMCSLPHSLRLIPLYWTIVSSITNIMTVHSTSDS